jgi:GNAT superfamily N-acetyltransferase
MTEPVSIRRNDRASLSRFAELNAQWIEELHVMEPSDKAMVATPEIYLEDGGQVFTAHIDGEVAGAVALKPHVDGPNQGQWELTKMAVDGRFRGNGVGQKLMDAVEAYARNDLGLKSLFLLSNTRNAAALRLYARNGWTVNHEGAHPIYARCNIGMEKVL